MRLTWFAIDAVPCMRFTIYPRLPAIFFLATRKMIIIVVTVFIVALCATRFFSPIIQVHCQCQWVWFNPFVHRTRALTSYERSLTRLFHFPHLKYRTLILFNRSIAWYDWGKNPKKKNWMQFNCFVSHEKGQKQYIQVQRLEKISSNTDTHNTPRYGMR